MAKNERGMTYAQAGVDIDAGNRMVDLIKPLVRATARPGADAEIGGFGGLFDLNDKMARMLSERQILWFRVDVAKSAEIAEHRSTLSRWLDALTGTSHITRVDWLA